MFPGALDYSRSGVKPGRTADVIAALESHVEWGPADDAWKGVLCDPQTSGGLLMAVARIAEKAGQYDDARLALERAVSVAAEDPRTRAALVEYHLRRTEYLQATVVLSEALKLYPTDPRLLRLADRLRTEVNRR